jgi:hypothetical protein
MKVNMIEMAERVRSNNDIPSIYDLTLGDTLQLMEMVKADPNRLYEAICIAYNFGFAQGNHATINRKLKKL